MRKTSILYLMRTLSLYIKKIFILKRRKKMKLTEKSLEVFSYVKENGGRVPIDELCEATGRAARSIGANVTDLCKKGLAARASSRSSCSKPTRYSVADRNNN